MKRTAFWSQSLKGNSSFQEFFFQPVQHLITYLINLPFFSILCQERICSIPFDGAKIQRIFYDYNIKYINQ